MKCVWLLLVCVLPSMCFAQTTVKYTLSGTYIAGFGGAEKTYSWSKIFGGCTDSNGPEFATGGDFKSYPVAYYGTLTFNGTTGLSAKLTTSVFNQSKSNATVPAPTWSFDHGNCVATFSNNGYAVFNPFTVVSGTGSYSINATGTGTLSVSLNGGIVVYFQTTGSFASCASGGTIYVVPNTIMLEALDPKTPNVIAETGVAEHANQVMMGCPPSFQ